MSEVRWMFSGGNTDDYTVYIGPVTVVKFSAKTAKIELASHQSGYRSNVRLDELYLTEDACRAQALARVRGTIALLEAKVDRMLEALGQPKRGEP